MSAPDLRLLHGFSAADTTNLNAPYSGVKWILAPDALSARIECRRAGWEWKGAWADEPEDSDWTEALTTQRARLHHTDSQIDLVVLP